jgi:hypothetical protein
MSTSLTIVGTSEPDGPLIGFKTSLDTSQGMTSRETSKAQTVT